MTRTSQDTILRGAASFCNRWSVAALLVTVATIVAIAQLGDASSTPASPLTAASERGPWQVSNVEELLDALQQVPARGGTIQLATGDYVLDQTIEVRAKSFLNIVGTGWDTRIIRRGEGDAVKLIDSSFGTIRNLLLQGDEAATSGSAIRYQGHCSSCVIDFCRIVNFPESGVCYAGDPQNPMSSNTVRDCHFIGNLGDQLASAHNNDFYIVGNQFGTHRGHPRSGCVLVHSSAGTYSMNYHWGNQVALRMGPSANFNRVENNRLEESRESALVLGTGADGEWNMFNIISGNTFHTNSQSQSGAFPAVVARNSHEITFCGNQVFSWDAQRLRHKHSLVIGENCDRWIVKDNILRHNADEAIVYEAATHTVVKDNLVE